MGVGKRSRAKGHNLERWLADWARNFLGYPHAKTTRQASKLLDDCGIDICFNPAITEFPFLIQAKAGYEKNRIKPDIEIKKVRNRIKEHFDEDHWIHKTPILVINKLNGKDSDNFIVSMNFLDFEKILKNNYFNEL